MSAGPGFVHAWQDLGEAQADTIEGVSASFDVALGAMVAEHTALGMDLVLSRAGDAEHGVLPSTVFTVVHLGVGVTHWLMPANFYLAGSLGLTRSAVEGSEVRLAELEIADSDPSRIGPSLHLGLGKLWWISRRWGLGASLSMLASSAANPVGDSDTRRNLLGVAATLTATYH